MGPSPRRRGPAAATEANRKPTCAMVEKRHCPMAGRGGRHLMHDAAIELPRIRWEKQAGEIDHLDSNLCRLCEFCGDCIPAERLEALPGVTSCVPCQSLSEQASQHVNEADWSRLDRLADDRDDRH